MSLSTAAGYIVSGKPLAGRLEGLVGSIASATVLLLVFTVGVGAGRVLAGGFDHTAILGSLAVVAVSMLLALAASVLASRVTGGG